MQDVVKIGEMIDDLKVTSRKKDEIDKINVFCEDHEASSWLKNLLGNKITKNLDIDSDTWGADELVKLAEKKARIFRKSIFVIDGDQKNNKHLKRSKCPRIVFLPGNCRPENIFYDFLEILDPADRFWGGVGGHTKQVCFRDRPSSKTNRDDMKKWFVAQQPNWGKCSSKLFNRWKYHERKESENFKNNFIKILQKLKI